MLPFHFTNFNFHLLPLVSHNICIHQFVIDFFFLSFYPWTLPLTPFLLLLFLCFAWTFHSTFSHFQIHNVACNWHEQMWKKLFIYVVNIWMDILDCWHFLQDNWTSTCHITTFPSITIIKKKKKDEFQWIL